MPDPALSLETPRIGFIGAGRLGKALACSFADRGLRVTTWRARRAIDACAIVFVTTPDASCEFSAQSVEFISFDRGLGPHYDACTLEVRSGKHCHPATDRQLNGDESC
jgi:hypothetical protein